MSEEPCAPQIAAEHARLKESAGKWQVECSFFMDPSGPPMKSQATETIEMLGELWNVSLFEAEMMGAPFQGRATLGYEPHNKRWVSTWVDSMSAHLFYFTGNFDAQSKVLTMTGEGPVPMSTEMTTFRTTEEWLDPNTRKFEMFMNAPGGGPEVPMMSYVYTRAQGAQ